ncbi:MAG: DPP IV N-terminal domain-containing protein, partial [Candidatus Cryptobacteroides sp.]
MRPEHNPQGKPLSMEDANINPKVYPERARRIPQQTKPQPRYGVTSGSVYMLDYTETVATAPTASAVTTATAAPSSTAATATTGSGESSQPALAIATTGSGESSRPAPDTVWIARAHDAVSYGVSVSRNEFGIDGGLFPSADGSRLAYYRKDESKVNIFPLLDISTRTGSLIELRYPMNGMDSERVDICVWDSAKRASITLDADALTEPAVCNPQTMSCTPELYGDDRYLTNISWQDSNTILVQVVDRSQHYCKLVSFNAATGELQSTLLREENPEWVEPYEPTHAISPQQFIYSTDNRDGFKNLYLSDLQGNIVRIPTAYADVRFKAYRDDWLYYTSSEVSPAENHLFRIRLTLPTERRTKAENFLQGVRFGKPQRLTREQGWHNIFIMDDGWMDVFSSFDNPGWSKVFSNDGKLRETLVESGDPLGEYAACAVEFGTVPSADGLYENHYRLIK